MKSLKTINPYFEAIWCHKQKFELRYNDRYFKEGDYYRLSEFDPVLDVYLDRFIIIKITYIMLVNEGFLDGWCLFGFDVIRRDYLNQ